MNVNQPFVNGAVAHEMLFQNQSPANVGQVYDIVVDVMNQMHIPNHQQTFDYVMNAITPIVQNAQWQTAQAQEMTVALTNAVTDVLLVFGLFRLMRDLLHDISHRFQSELWA